MSLRARIENEHRKDTAPDQTPHGRSSVVGVASFNRSRRSVQDKLDSVRREQNTPAARRRRQLELTAAEWERYEKDRKARRLAAEHAEKRRAEEREQAKQKLNQQLRVVYSILDCTNEEVKECVRRLDKRGVALTSRALYDEVKALRKERSGKSI